MPLPEFNEFGDLPEGRHSATLDEVIARFSHATAQRAQVTTRLQRIHELAVQTGQVDRLVLDSTRHASWRVVGRFPRFLANDAGRASPGHRGDKTMIQNDKELSVTRERISYLLDLLARLRQSARPEELALVSSGYRSEVERMQREVLDYLTQPSATAKAG